MGGGGGVDKGGTSIMHGENCFYGKAGACLLGTKGLPTSRHFKLLFIIPWQDIVLLAGRKAGSWSNWASAIDSH